MDSLQLPIALYNLAPLGLLLVTGASLALVPVLWVGWRTRGASKQQGPAIRLRALTWTTLFLTFDLVVFGAFTRLTDSGLGCPDWPGCYGHASPVGAATHIASAQQALPTGPVTFPKAWIEMIHRYLATGVGALIVWLTWAAWREWRQTPSATRLRLFYLSAACLVWVLVQGAFGALTVTMKLFPAIVSLHLLGGMTGLALLTLLARRRSQTAIEEPFGPPISTGTFGADGGIASRSAGTSLMAGKRIIVGLTFAVLALQIALGAWVSTNYAVLACSDFPRCQGSFWPAMNFSQGFELWRGLGITAKGEAIVFEALTAIHFTHRAFAAVVLPLLFALAWHLHQTKATQPLSRWLAGLSVLQLATGLSNVVLGWPLFAALLHTAGAGALVIVLTWALTPPRLTGARP